MHDNADYVTLAVSDEIGEKALRLLAQNRIILGPSGIAHVGGDTDVHQVIARPDSVWCDCPAWKRDRYCSHAVAAMIAWGDLSAY